MQIESLYFTDHFTVVSPSSPFIVESCAWLNTFASSLARLESKKQKAGEYTTALLA